MLDCVLVSNNGFKRVIDTKLWKESPESDHVGVAMEFAVSTIKHTGERRVSRGVIDWETIENNPDEQRKFQERIKQLVGNGPVAYSDYMAIIIRAGYDIATKNVEVSKGWFEENREVLQLLCKQRDELSRAHREEKDPEEKKKKKRVLEIVRAFLKGKLADAKASWSREIAEKIHEMNTTPKTAWKAAYELMAGLLGHSKKHITVSL